jgi:hypothetical protein
MSFPDPVLLFFFLNKSHKIREGQERDKYIEESGDKITFLILAPVFFSNQEWAFLSGVH